MGDRAHSSKSGRRRKTAEMSGAEDEWTSASEEGRGPTDAGGGGEVGLVAHVAVAAEGADGVDALAVAAQIRQHLALVDV